MSITSKHFSTTFDENFCIESETMLLIIMSIVSPADS